MPSSTESRELQCLTAISEGRRYFFEKIVAHAMSHFRPSEPDRALDDVIAVLRTDNSYYLAEFFYLAKELNLRDPDIFRMLLHKHNTDMGRLQGDKLKVKLMGIRSVERVNGAVFSEEQMKKIFNDNGLDADGEIPLDQSDISKLVATLMSFETCRQTILAFYESQLLNEDPPPDNKNRTKRGKVLVSSPGFLEEYFRAHLIKIDRLIRGEEISSVSLRVGEGRLCFLRLFFCSTLLSWLA
jgi:hypothetical protein